MQSKQLEGFHLSPQQKHVWLLQQREQTQPYCVQGEILINGSLSEEALRTALQTIVCRHEILRTTFRCLPGMTVPLQIIAEKDKISLYEQNLTALSPQAQSAAAESLFEKLKHQPFVFDVSPPFTVHLLRFSSEKHVLIIRLSALIADGTTLKQIVNELSILHSASLQAKNTPTDVMQYADIAEWQNELLDQTGAGQEYWQAQNVAPHNSTAGLSFLERDKKNRPETESPVETISVNIEANLVDKISSLASGLEGDISAVLLSCWQILLWRLTGRQALTLGIASSGRQYAELTHALGPLSKSLPIFFELEDHLSFEQVLEQVSKSVNDAHEWQDYFAGEISTSQANSDSRLPVCAFCFEFEEWPEAYCQADVSFSLHKRYSHTESARVNLFCLRQGSRLSTDFCYDSRFYSDAEIKELSEWFLTLLENSLSSPDSAIGHLRLLSDCQRQKLLTQFNQTQAESPENQCIHQLFEAQVKQTPHDIAAVFENQQLTYAELNAKANQLAHNLQRLGVGAEKIVGIYLERSLDWVICLLAILKAGGAYLPLEPALPKESLVFRLADARAAVLVSQENLMARLPDLDIPRVCLEAQWETLAQESQDNLSSCVSPENLAYVLFTSGSTGQPKGVAVEHRQLCNYINAIAQTLNLSTCKSFATVSTFAADLGNTTIFPALLGGGCLHIISADRTASPEALAEYFHHHPIDCLKIVPSHLAALLTSSQPAQILPRQRLVLGGEACRWQLVEQIHTYAPDCLIFNHYGPTEATVGVSVYPINSETLSSGQQATVPIGRPIANTQIYLLDTDLQPVPIGVPGELYIGGAGVARGYLNRPDLTAERFIPNPFLEDRRQKAKDGSHDTSPTSPPPPPSPPPHSPTSPLPSTLYKTGDLARYQPDGTLEYLGRLDHQVKIRGYRIELGEIEVVLRQHPEVQAAVVLARKAQSGNPCLVAYVVPKKQSALTNHELRELIKAQLPDYMLPAAFVQLKTLPLTPNGKVDSQALLDLDLSPPDREDSFVAPGSVAEKTLAQIWAQTLRIEKIGIHDNFFDLGGDSILSIQIVARANQAGLKLTPKQVFENQTIAELAAVATTQQLIQAEQGPVGGAVPLTPIQHWFFDQPLPDRHHWNQSILLEVRQTLAIDQLEQAVQILLAHHDTLRLRFIYEEASWQQFEAAPDPVTPLAWVDLSTVSESDQRLALTTAAAELQASLNLSAGPLIRVAYFDLGPDRAGRLLLVIHHLAVDGVSWRILLEDLQIVHHQLSQGSVVQLPPKTTSFQYWAKQLVDYAQSDLLQQELDYWLKQSRQPVAPLPVDWPKGDSADNPDSDRTDSDSTDSNTVARAQIVSVALNEAETLTLLQEVPTAYRTQINDVLLTALAQAFARWTGERSL
ncbi:MAG: amino acid adenylation domain-containing protein, partial [Cyanobacteria bacterium P01_G01_bin.38]